MLSSDFYIAEPGDRVISKAGAYNVILRIKDQSGLALLCKLSGQGVAKIIARSEDIIPQIEKLVPPKEALELASQLVRSEIMRKDGFEKAQVAIDLNIKKYGVKFYSYLTPLSVEAYKENRVIIPIK